MTKQAQDGRSTTRHGLFFAEAGTCFTASLLSELSQILA
jgi:hypothetical protein